MTVLYSVVSAFYPWIISAPLTFKYPSLDQDGVGDDTIGGTGPILQ